MAFSASFPAWLQMMLASLITAALFYFGNGLEPVWPLMWIAWIPTLWLSLHSRWSAAAAGTFTAMLLGNLYSWSYFTHTLGMPATVWLGIFVSASAFAALGMLLFRALALRGRYGWAAVAFPAFWVSTEFVRNLTTPHGTAGSLAYSQLGFLPFLQLASLTGPWGMTFVLLLLQCSLVLFLSYRGEAMRVLLMAIVCVACILIFGTLRLKQPASAMVRVGLIASDFGENGDVAQAGPSTENLVKDYSATAQTLIQAGARVVVLPEKIGITVQDRSSDTDSIFQALTDRTGAIIIAGFVHVDGAKKYNRARIFIPRADPRSYDKQHMLPPFESAFTPGTSLALLSQPTSPWGVAICKDFDFRNPSQTYGKAGIGLMLVPAWDFVVDAGWHGHIAVMRGVENGYSIARSAKGGYLTVSDSRGRILAEQRSNAAPFASIITDVPTTHNRTLYQIAGDWFAWLCLSLLAASMIRLFV